MIAGSSGFYGFLASAKKTAQGYVENFLSGFGGWGWKIWKRPSGKHCLEIDDIVVRNTLTAFELLISQIRAIRGALAITQGQGKIKEVESNTTEYILTFEEEELTFVANDFVRHKTAMGGYHVKVSAIRDSTKVVLLKSSFLTGMTTPKVGDELVQFGNSTDTTRQSAIYLHTDEGGKPAIDLMFGINSTDWTNCVKLRIGGDIPGSTGSNGFYCENGTIVSVNATGETMYILRPNGSGFFAKGNISWDAAGNVTFGSGVKLSWDNLEGDPPGDLKGDPGDPGEPAYNLSLSNENTSVPADYSGVVQSYANAKTSYVLFKGSTDITELATYTTTGSPGLLFSSSLVGSPRNITVQSMTTDTAYIDIVASLGDKVVASSRFCLTRVCAGEAGEDAIIYSIVPSHTAVHKNKAGVLNPTSVEVLIARQQGSSYVCPYTGNDVSLTFRRNGGTVDTNLPTLGGSWSVSIGTSEYIDFTLKAGSVVLDKQRVIVVEDGADGADGVDANLLPWVDDWNNNKTQIGAEFVISPKMFSGTRDTVTGKLTGVAMGRALTLAGQVRTGLFGIKNDVLTFLVDAETGESLFCGTMNIGAGKNVINPDGTGSLASGNILWDATGQVRINGVIKNRTITINSSNYTDYFLDLGGAGLTANLTKIGMNLYFDLSLSDVASDILYATLDSDESYIGANLYIKNESGRSISITGHIALSASSVDTGGTTILDGHEAILQCILRRFGSGSSASREIVWVSQFSEPIYAG